MIVHKNAESVNIFEVLIICLPSASNCSHASSIHPDISDCVVHRIVEEAGDVVLVRANVSIISVEALTHLEDTC